MGYVGSDGVQQGFLSRGFLWSVFEGFVKKNKWNNSYLTARDGKLTSPWVSLGKLLRQLQRRQPEQALRGPEPLVRRVAITLRWVSLVASELNSKTDDAVAPNNPQGPTPYSLFVQHWFGHDHLRPRSCKPYKAPFCGLRNHLITIAVVAINMDNPNSTNLKMLSCTLPLISAATFTSMFWL